MFASGKDDRKGFGLPLQGQVSAAGRHIIELLLRILTEDAVWAGCLLALMLGSVSEP